MAKTSPSTKDPADRRAGGIFLSLLLAASVSSMVPRHCDSIYIWLPYHTIASRNRRPDVLITSKGITTEARSSQSISSKKSQPPLSFARKHKRRTLPPFVFISTTLQRVSNQGPINHGKWPLVFPSAQGDCDTNCCLCICGSHLPGKFRYGSCSHSSTMYIIWDALTSPQTFFYRNQMYASVILGLRPRA